MNLSEVTKLFAFTAGGFILSVSAYAITDFTETFETDASGWLNGENPAGPVTWNPTGGVGNSSYISYTPPAFNSGGGGFGGDPLRLLFRANDSNNASDDAFVGDWVSSNVESFSVDIRHNHTESLNFYARFAANESGGGASMANNSLYAVASDTWTTVTVDIEDANPPFSSYGSSGSFNNVFSSIINMQLGLYLPGNTQFDSLTVDLDNVSVTVPEPASLGVMGLMLGGLLSRRRA
ncbi:MAG: PEP-CTERM sorting domain-containing protein [Planctomycetota bacterium]